MSARFKLKTDNHTNGNKNVDSAHEYNSADYAEATLYLDDRWFFWLAGMNYSCDSLG